MHACVCALPASEHTRACSNARVAESFIWVLLISLKNYGIVYCTVHPGSFAACGTRGEQNHADMQQRVFVDCDAEMQPNGFTD